MQRAERANNYTASINIIPPVQHFTALRWVEITTNARPTDATNRCFCKGDSQAEQPPVGGFEEAPEVYKYGVFPSEGGGI